MTKAASCRRCHLQACQCLKAACTSIDASDGMTHNSLTTKLFQCFPRCCVHSYRPMTMAKARFSIVPWAKDQSRCANDTMSLFPGSQDVIQGPHAACGHTICSCCITSCRGITTWQVCLPGCVMQLAKATSGVQLLHCISEGRTTAQQMRLPGCMLQLDEAS